MYSVSSQREWLRAVLSLQGVYWRNSPTARIPTCPTAHQFAVSVSHPLHVHRQHDRPQYPTSRCASTCRLPQPSRLRLHPLVCSHSISSAHTTRPFNCSLTRSPDPLPRSLHFSIPLLLLARLPKPIRPILHSLPRRRLPIIHPNLYIKASSHRLPTKPSCLSVLTFLVHGPCSIASRPRSFSISSPHYLIPPSIGAINLTSRASLISTQKCL